MPSNKPPAGYNSWSDYEKSQSNKLKHSSERQRNNPNNEPTGHHTGRCSACGSDNLWDDMMHYGCNSCGANLG